MRFLASLLALTLVSAPAFAAPNCTKGKRCGNTCIAASKTCHVGTGGSGRTLDAFVVPVPDEIPPDDPPDVDTLEFEDDPDTEQGGEIGPDGEVRVDIAEDSRTEIDGKPTATACRREDFDDFDAFVECRVSQQGVTSPAAPPPIDPAEQARQREAAEARAELGRQANERAAAVAAEKRRTRATVLSLVVSGSVLDAAGLGLIGGAYAMGDYTPPPPDDGPICTVGKRCGDACIAAELMCHTPTGNYGSTKADPRLLWPGVALITVGTGLLVAALVIYRRNNPRTSLLVNARGVGFRF